MSEVKVDLSKYENRLGGSIGEGAVVGARAAVFKDVAPWTVVGGNPAKFIKNRKTYNM